MRDRPFEDAVSNCMEEAPAPMKSRLAQFAPILVALAALGSSACGGPSGCEGGGPASPCPPPSDGFALVEGVVMRADGTPVRGVEVDVICPVDPTASSSPYGVRLGDSRNSDRAGRYRVWLTLDTVGGRWVDWSSAGTYVTDCDVYASNGKSAPDTAAVTFYRRREDVVATPVDVRMPED